MFQWFDTRTAFAEAIRELEAYRVEVEAWIETQEIVPGYCYCCEQMVLFNVAVGGYYGRHPNLREALVCPACRLSNRNRLLYQSVMLAAQHEDAPDIAILERMSPLFTELQRVFPSIIGSEYLGNEVEPGATDMLHGYPIRHESITNLSFDTGSLDFFLHCEVLGHVHDYRRALREAARVLKKDSGVMLFTVPFFMTRNKELELARPNADGSVKFFSAPEYHSSRIRPENILAWHHFGWGLLDDLTSAGFANAQIGLAYDPMCGYTTNNHPTADYGLMYPLILRAER